MYHANASFGTYPGPQATLGADPIIEPNAARDLLDIGADLLAKIRDFNKGNLGVDWREVPGHARGLSFHINED